MDFVFLLKKKTKRKRCEIEEFLRIMLPAAKTKTLHAFSDPWDMERRPG